MRQDTVAYFRGRLPNPRWKPALLPVRILNASFHGLARRLKTTVVGDELSRSYGGERSGLLPITVSLVRNAGPGFGFSPAGLGRTIELLTVGRVNGRRTRSCA